MPNDVSWDELEPETQAPTESKAGTNWDDFELDVAGTVKNQFARAPRTPEELASRSFVPGPGFVSQPPDVPPEETSEYWRPGGKLPAGISELPKVSGPPGLPDTDFEPENPLKTIGRMGKFIPAGLADITAPEEGNRFANLQAVAEDVKPPYQQRYEMPYMPKSISIPGKTAAAVLEITPKMAAVMASGPAAPATAAAMFGFDDEGNFHPVTAGVAAALPFVGNFAGPIAEALATRLGVSSEAALNLVNAGGRYGAANAVMAAQALPGWGRMTDAQKQDAIAGILANGFLGLADFHGSETPQGQDERAWQEFTKSPGYKQHVEQQAAAGGKPLAPGEQVRTAADDRVNLDRQIADTQSKIQRAENDLRSRGIDPNGVFTRHMLENTAAGVGVPELFDLRNQLLELQERRQNIPENAGMLPRTNAQLGRTLPTGPTGETGQGEVLNVRAKPVMGPPGQRGPRPEVPGTEAQPYETDAAEVRRLGLTTRKQVIDHFNLTGPGARERAADILRRANEGGETDAENREATEVHGALRPQPGQGAGEVPAPQRGGGNVPQAEGGIPQGPQGQVLLNDIQRLARAPAGEFAGQPGSAGEAEKVGSRAKTRDELELLQAAEGEAARKAGESKDLGERAAGLRKKQFFSEAVRHAIPRVVANESGWTFNPAKQFGVFTPESLEQMSPEERKILGPQLEALSNWEFTDRRKGSPTEGITLYVPQGTDYESLSKAIKTKTGEILAARSNLQVDVPTSTLEGVRTEEAPVSEIDIDNELVPNFKRGAEPETGLVAGQRLQGKYSRVGTAPIVVWRLRNGRKVVVTGRHRLDLAKRTGEQTIPVQFVDEASGFTQADALNLDAEANIRDGQGDTEDYANFFRRRIAEGYTESQALEQGLLSRAKGKAGWDIAKDATDDVYASFRADKINEAHALAIARAAPGDEGAQRVGLKYALQGKEPAYVGNLVRAAQARGRMEQSQPDLFGATEMKGIEDIAQRATEAQRDLRKQIAAVSGAAKNPEAAAKLGVDVKDPVAVRDRIAQLRYQLNQWETGNHPELLAMLRGEKGPKPEDFGFTKEPGAYFHTKLTGTGEGRISVDFREADRIHILGVSVNQLEQSKGIGSGLVEDVKKVSEATGKPITLTAHGNPGQQERLERFYERAGFRKTGELDNGKPVYQYTPKGEGTAAAPTPEPTKLPETKTFFDPETQKRVDELNKRLREKLGGLSANPFFDPELFQIGGELAFHYIKAGMRRFGDFANAMVKQLGEKAKPYLLSWYNKARMQMPEIAHELDSESAAAKIAQEHFGIGPAAGEAVSGRVPGGGGGRGRPGVRVAREELIPRPQQHVGNDSYAARSGIRLDDEQVKGVNLILDRFTKNQPSKTGEPVAFLLADGTGFGKTIQLLAVADQYRRKGLGNRILFVTKNKQIAEGRFAADAERMGIDPRSYQITTYTGLDKLSKSGLRDWDLILYDEAHMLKNAEAKKSMAAARLRAKHEVMATATPMDKPEGAAYFLSKISGEAEEKVAERLGYKLVEKEDPETKEIYQVPRLLKGMDWGKVWQNIMDFRDASVAAGAMIRREYPFFGNVNVTELPMGEGAAAEQKKLLKHFDDLIANSASPTFRRNMAGQKTLSLSRWAEQRKVSTALDMALDHVKKGGQVIIVAETANRQSFREAVRGSRVAIHPVTGADIHVVPGAISQLVTALKDRGVAPSDIAHIYDPTANDIRQNVKRFQEGKAKIALATPQSGGTGIDLDDVRGDAPRLMIALSKNMAGDDFEQLVGRVSRKNTASPAEVRFLHLNGSFADERRNDILAKKIKTLRAIQGGEELDVARGFKKAPTEEIEQAEKQLAAQPPESPEQTRDRLQEEAAKRQPYPEQPLPPGVTKGPGMFGMGGAMAYEFPATPSFEDLLSGQLAPPRGQEGVPPQQTGTMRGSVGALGDVFSRWISAGKGMLAGLAGHTFPKTTQLDPRLGELGARWVSSLIAARPMAEVFAADAIGNSGVDAVKLGAALTEDNLRSIKAAFEEKADEAENKDEIISDIREQLAELADMGDDEDPNIRGQKLAMLKEIDRLKRLTPADAERFRRQAADVKSFVGKEGFPFDSEDAYQAFLDDPRTQEVVQRHISNWNAIVEPMYRNAQMIDPDVELPTRGLQTGARINLKAYLGEENEPVKNVVGVRRGNLLGTLRRKSPFGVQAKGTGEAYHIDYYDLMENTFGRQLEIANKNAFEKGLVEAGHAIEGRPGLRPVIDGQEVGPDSAFPLKRRTLVIPGREALAQNTMLYINPKIANEYRIGANVDANPGKVAAFIQPFTRALNFAALASGTDVSTHVVNQLSTLASLPGASGRLLQDSLLSAVPGRPDILVSIGRALYKGFQDNRAQLASLAEIGALRPRHEVTHIPFFRQAAQVVQWMDRSTRLALDDAYQRLAHDGIVEQSETARREFVNQIGQYNKRAQGYFKRWFRDTGLGPFVTAGTTFNTLGIRAITLNPGVKARSMPAALALRANMAAKLVGTAATVAILNYLLTKDKGGGAMGRPGTPIGDIDLGTDDKSGKPNHLAVFSMIGPGRGARVLGIRGFAQSKMMGLPTGTAMNTAERDMLNSAISPWAGPAVKFATTTATGFPTAVGVGRLSPVVPPGRNQFMQNFKTAVIEANPLVSGINKANQPGGDWTDAVRGQLPRFLPQTGRPASMMQNYPDIVRRAQANAYIEDVIGRARRMSPEARTEFLRDALDRLEDPRDRQMALRQFKYRKLTQ